MLREDVKYYSNLHWEPKVPSDEAIVEQAVKQIKRGKSSGNVALDRKAMEKIKKEEEESER